MEIKIKQLSIGEFVNYKKPSLLIGLPYCSFKCEKESGIACCQNSELATSPIIYTTTDRLIEIFDNSDICEAVVFGGLEPFDSWIELLDFIKTFRVNHNSDIVIYTGYNKEEIIDKINILQNYNNIIIKYGRFIPNQKSKYDDILGITLASPNQYAEVL